MEGKDESEHYFSDSIFKSRHVFGEEVSLETFIILDSILHFIPDFNEKIQETVIWPDLYSMCLKYAPFLNVNKQKYVDILKKQVELHYA